MTTRWAATALLVAALLPAACTSGGGTARPRATHRTLSAPHVVQALTRFAAVTLAHPATWRAYVEAGGGDLPDGDAAFLTDAPIEPRCSVVAGSDVSSVRCPGPVTGGVHRLGAGGVLVEVTMYDQPGGPARHGALDVAGGYRGRVHSTDGDECLVARGDSGLEATLEPRARARQPSLVDVTGCFGPRSGPQRRAFRRMVSTLRIHSRPDESVPVPGAPRCSHHDLTLSQVRGEGVDSAESILRFRATEVGRRPCYVSGFAHVSASDAHGDRLPFVDRRTAGLRHPSRPLYLRPHLTATLSLIVSTCMVRPRTAAANAHIQLFEVRRPFRVRLSARRVRFGGLTFCGTPADPDVVYTEPLIGN